jgi:prepilin peptidase CpaA
MTPFGFPAPLSPGGEAALALYVFALVLAALSDLRRLRIPNWLTAGLAAAFPVAALMGGQEVHWLSHLLAGLAVFAGAAVLFACRVMGGGDVKLLAAVALWAGAGQVLPFLMLVALAGGAFAALVLVLRQPVVQGGILWAVGRLPGFMHGKMPIPYGVPIAAAGILMAPALPILG